jgi:NADH:ubiquinone oxidoreductase subunit 6 (subunit J)
VRAALVIVGLVIGGYGVWLLWEFPWAVIVNIAVWAGVGVVVHDFVFAPLCALLGWSGRRLIRGRWWAPVSVAAVCTVVLALLAIPVYAKPGAHPDNPTVLDRNYPMGLLIALAVVWACVPLYHVIAGRLPVREDEAVDQECADDVESEPPAV